MRTKCMKVALVAISLMGIPCIEGVCPILADEIILMPVGPLGDGNDDNPEHNRGPQLPVPYVEIKDTSDELSFTSSFTLSASIEIENEFGNIVQSDALVFNAGTPAQLSISTLSSGCYTLRLIIDEVVFEGVFEL